MNVQPSHDTFTQYASFPVLLPGEEQKQLSEEAAVERPGTTSVWGTEFAQLDMRGTLDLAKKIIESGRPEYFVTANLNYLMLTEQHPKLEEVNSHSIAVIADGHPIVARSKIGKQQTLPNRVAGSDMIVELARQAELYGHRMFLLGAAEGVADKAAKELLRQFPKLQISGVHSPPFRPLTQAEHQELVTTIKRSDTDILLVAFGQPKGEFWIYDHHKDLGVPLSIQLGASFDFLAGTAKRAPALFQRLGCEWLYRAFMEPKRLGPRYVNNIFFLLGLLTKDLFSFLRGIAQNRGLAATDNSQSPMGA